MIEMRNRLKEYRAKHDLTQEQLGKKVNTTRQTINAIEKDRYNPSLKLAFKLAKLFQCQIEDLFFDEE